MNKEYFIKRARDIHGDKYDYSKVELSYGTDKVEIICPSHGSFIQRAKGLCSTKQTTISATKGIEL